MSAPDRADQARAAWEPIGRDARRRRWRKIVVREGPWPGAGRASLWALSQVVQAAVDLSAIDVVSLDEVRDLLRTVETHRHGDAYDAFPGSGERYYDDNAWLALALLDGADVGLDEGVGTARRLLGFLRDGTRDGGVYWVERPRRSRHTCSTGPAAEVAFRLALAASGAKVAPPDRPAGEPTMAAMLGRSPIDHGTVDADRGFGEAAMTFLLRELRGSDGLFADNVDDDGTVEPTRWSYNQGTPVGAGVLWHQLTGDQVPLDIARETAAAAVAHFVAEDRLWKQPAAFNAIFLRNLLLLDEVAGFPNAPVLVDSYLDRVWHEARDPATGWFTEGGIGRYERGGSLDQAALVQLFARRARGGAPLKVRDARASADGDGSWVPRLVE